MGHRLRWVALLGVALLAFTAFLDVTIVNTAIPFIQEAFKSPILELQWIMTVFSIVLTVMMVAAGRFADLYGRKKVFFVGVWCFGCAALGAGFSPTMGVLVFFRGLQGLGSSILFVSSASLITEMFKPQERGKAIGFYAVITGIGLAIGPFIGGALVQGLSWRWVFWVHIPIIILGLLICFFTLRPPKHHKSNVKIEARGLVLLVLGLSGLIYGMIDAASSAHVQSFLIMGAGILILSLFIWNEKRSQTPLFEASFFKNKLILLSLLSCMIAGLVTFVFMFFDPIYLKTARKLSAIQVGLLITIIPVAQVIVSSFFSVLLKRLGVYKIMMISIITGFIAIAFHGLIREGSSIFFLIVPFALLGINWSFSNAGTIAAVNLVVQPDKISLAIGSIFMMWNMSGAIFLSLSSVIFHLVEKTHSFHSAFHAMVLLNAIFAFLIMVAALLRAFGTKVQN